MDRPISTQRLQSRATRSRLKVVAVLAVAVLGLALLRSVVRPSIDRDDIRTARVTRGEVRASVSAAGLVVPLEERVVSALFDSQVVEVLAVPGASVDEGQAILRLDGRALELEIADLEDELALKENLRRGERLVLEESLDDYRARLELLTIDLESREAALDRAERLAADGAISQAEVFEAELGVKRTAVEVEQVGRSVAHAESSAVTQLERIGLETAILRNQLREKQRQLSACLVAAPRSGVVTWAIEELGTRVTAGMALVRVADLSAFKVEAQLSDFYASRLHDGLSAEVSVGEAKIAAEVAAILPTVEEGQMTLLVELDEPKHQGLRPRLRVDVEVISGQVQGALGLKNGPGIGSGSRQDVYRIVDGYAERTQVLFGISSRHRVQVLEGLGEGDEVILSDTRDIEHLERIRVKGKQ